MNNSLIVIPVRMASKRFPGKPLVEIYGKSMIYHVWERAVKSKVGDVLVACCDEEVMEYLKINKIKYVYTKKNLISGTDRVYEAIRIAGKLKDYKYIINLQGDLPNINPADIRKLSNHIRKNNSEIVTLATKIKDKKKVKDENIVKVAISKNNNAYKAIFFSRAAIPYNSPSYYEHVGIYAYDIAILERFIALKQGALEKLESLEQLRALENRINIDVSIINKAPYSIDTPIDLKNYLNSTKKN